MQLKVAIRTKRAKEVKNTQPLHNIKVALCDLCGTTSFNENIASYKVAFILSFGKVLF